MSDVTFELRRQPETWLDLSALTPDKLHGHTLTAIKAIRLRCGRRAGNVGDLFQVSGDDPLSLRFVDACRSFVRLGHGMTRGRIRVDGHAGHYLGQDMRGGQITVRGSAGNWLGAGMSGGSIEISGDAGDFIGAAVAGAMHGMTGGNIVVGGNAGKRAADRMRRGTILVLGDAGDFAGSRMIAGTLLILGLARTGVGYGMRRGTIVLGRMPAHVPVTFNDCGRLKMEFLRLLFKQTADSRKRFGYFREFGPEARRFAGDIAAGGQGEILVLLNASRRRSA